MEEPVEDVYESEEILDAARTLLSGKKGAELRSLAEEQGIDISGLEAKTDMVDTIALHPGIARILGLSREPRREKVGIPVLEDEAARIQQEESEAPAPLPALGQRVHQALQATVDLAPPAHSLADTSTTFQERRYDAAVQTAKDSVFIIEEKVKDYLATGWAFGIASAQRILETSNRSSQAAKEAERYLEEAMEAFEGESFVTSPGLLERLAAAALDLYAYEMSGATEHVESQERALEDIQAMGGDVAAGATMLGRAREALDENDRANYLDLIEEADRLVVLSKDERIDEIKEAAASVETIIEEARSIGSDMEEASELLDDVTRAIESSEFVSAHDLISRAERAALESQKAHMDRVAEMRNRQAEKVRELIGQIKPLLDAARAAGFRAEEAMEDLKAAVNHVKDGDYVNGLIVAKKAYRAAKSFRSQMEAKKLEAASVGTDEPHEVVAGETEAEESSEPFPTCIKCGSRNIKVGPKGRARCGECGRKFRVTASA